MKSLACLKSSAIDCKRLVFYIGLINCLILLKSAFVDCKGQFKMSKNKDKDSDAKWNRDKFYYMNQVSYGDPFRFGQGIFILSLSHVQKFLESSKNSENWLFSPQILSKPRDQI